MHSLWFQEDRQWWMQRAVIAIALGTVGLAEWVISIVSTSASCCNISRHTLHSREVDCISIVMCFFVPFWSLTEIFINNWFNSVSAVGGGGALPSISIRYMHVSFNQIAVLREESKLPFNRTMALQIIAKVQNWSVYCGNNEVMFPEIRGSGNGFMKHDQMI